MPALDGQAGQPGSADHTGAADQGGTGEAPLLHSEGGGHLVGRDQAGHRARLGDEAVDLRRVDPGVLAGRTGSLDDERADVVGRLADELRLADAAYRDFLSSPPRAAPGAAIRKSVG